MPDHNQSVFASTSVARHLTRGAIGFGLVGSALALTPSVGLAALLLAPLGMVALRGCPMCWMVGLIETISAGRLQRTCTDKGCTLRSSTPDSHLRDHDDPGRGTIDFGLWLDPIPTAEVSASAPARSSAGMPVGT